MSTKRHLGSDSTKTLAAENDNGYVDVDEDNGPLVDDSTNNVFHASRPVVNNDAYLKWGDDTMPAVSATVAKNEVYSGVAQGTQQSKNPAGDYNDGYLDMDGDAVTNAPVADNGFFMKLFEIPSGAPHQENNADEDDDDYLDLDKEASQAVSAPVADHDFFMDLDTSGAPRHENDAEEDDAYLNMTQ